MLHNLKTICYTCVNINNNR